MAVEDFGGEVLKIEVISADHRNSRSRQRHWRRWYDVEGVRSPN
jgi:hypothetical protein